VATDAFGPSAAAQDADDVDRDGGQKGHQDRDTDVESSETFLVNLSNSNNASPKKQRAVISFPRRSNLDSIGSIAYVADLSLPRSEGYISDVDFEAD